MSTMQSERIYTDHATFNQEGMREDEFQILREDTLAGNNDLYQSIADIMFWYWWSDEHETDRELLRNHMNAMSQDQWTALVKEVARNPVAKQRDGYDAERFRLSDEMFWFWWSDFTLSRRDVAHEFDYSSYATASGYIDAGALLNGYIPPTGEKPALHYSDETANEIVADIYESGILLDQSSAREQTLDAALTLSHYISLHGFKPEGRPSENKYVKLLRMQAFYTNRLAESPRDGKHSAVADVREVQQWAQSQDDNDAPSLHVFQKQYDAYWEERNFTGDDGHKVLNANAIARQVNWREINMVAAGRMNVLIAERVGRENATFHDAIAEVKKLCAEIDVDITDLSYGLSRSVAERDRKHVLDALSFLSLLDPEESLLPHRVQWENSDLTAELLNNRFQESA